MYEWLPQPTAQHQITLAFYRLAFPDWDTIVKIDGYPLVSEKTWKYIMEKFMAFDRRMHPDVLPGGHWALGSGFSGPHCKEERERVPDWQIDISPCKLVYPDTPFRFTITENIYGEPPEQYRHYRARLIYEGELHGQVDPTDEYKRYATVDAALAACVGRAPRGASLTFSPLPNNEWGESVWQSNTVHSAATMAA
jgi:hypothetical protein